MTNPLEPVDIKALEASAGIGVIVTPEEIERVIEQVIQENKDRLLEQRYSFPIGTLLGEVRKRLPWADGKATKSELDVQVRGTFFSLENFKVEFIFIKSVTRSSWSK